MAKIRKSPQVIETRKMHVSGSIRPNSYNPETREITVEFASAHPVRRYNWRRDEEYDEVLEISEAAADLGRVNAGTAVLINHERWGKDANVGVTVRGWIEGGKAVAVLRLSGRKSLEEFREDVADGIWKNISFGYVVKKYQRYAGDADKGTRTKYVGKEWETHEITFAAIPADPTVGVRSEGGKAPELEPNERFYTTTLIDTEMAGIRKSGDSLTLEDPNEENEREEPTNENPANPAPAAQRTTPAPASEQRTETVLTQADVQAQIREATKAERLRTSSINVMVERMGLSPDFARELTEQDITIDQAREKIFDKLADGAPNIRGNQPVRVTKDKADAQRQIKAVALAIRSNEVNIAKIDEAIVREAMKFQSFSLLNMARMSLEDAGERTASYSDFEIVDRAISQSTSDFPNLLGGIVHQILLTPQGIIADTWTQTAKIISVSDFREHSFLRTWGVGNLDPISETGEFKDKPLADATAERISIKTVGNIFNMSRQMIINDELDAFSRAVGNAIRAWDRTIETAYYQVLNSNPNLADGQPLFSTARGNLATTGTIMNSANLDLMRVAMSEVMDPGALDYLDLKPSILLTHSSLEKIAKQYNDSIYDLDATQKTAFKPSLSAGLFDKVVGTPRLNSRTQYIAFADPNVEPVMAVAFLRGQRRPTIARHEPFRQEGVLFRISGDFGVGPVGWKGAYKNAGAAS